MDSSGLKEEFDLDRCCPSREESDCLWLKMSRNNIVFLSAVSFSLVSDNPSVVFSKKVPVWFKSFVLVSRLPTLSDKTLRTFSVYFTGAGSKASR